MSKYVTVLEVCAKFNKDVDVRLYVVLDRRTQRIYVVNREQLLAM